MPSTLRPWLLALLPLGYLWFTLINQLAPEWSSNPQYGYGWAVPVLCLGLLLQRWQEARAALRSGVSGQPSLAHSLPAKPLSAFSFPPSAFPFVAIFLLAVGALFFLPARMLQAADPAWRLVDWLLAIDVVGLTLCGLYLSGGGTWVRRYAFPICFFLVAVPWLYPIEKWLIDHLTFAVSAATVEVLGFLGMPAVAHGNVIEVGTGVVGLSEACSGIRSFQSSLMISLCLGALYGLTIGRRIWLVPIGFVLSFIFNVCRTSLLTSIAAKKGVEAIAAYHDQAGVSIMLACTASMWCIALLLKRGQGAAIRGQKAEVSPHQPVISRAEPFVSDNPQSTIRNPHFGKVSSQWSAVSRLSLCLLVWFALVELGVAVWSRGGVGDAEKTTRWSMAWPAENSTFKRVEPSGDALKLLQYDEAQQGQWSESNGTTWSAFYFNWLPGRVGAYLAANRHSPEICMTYAGWEMRSGPERVVVEVKNLHLPFRRYAFSQGANLLHVFHCRWEPAFETNPAALQEQGQGTTLRGLRGLSVLWNRKGKGGQKILEVIVQGCDTPDAAQVALVRQLEKLIKIEPPIKLVRSP